ncbi:MAG: MBL fold metallo-hydrolase [Gammaproteobacteria bacterium]|jgi:glyoxylase-like metal-dependent hydrolase (beta-lactamase superfamily II)
METARAALIAALSFAAMPSLAQVSAEELASTEIRTERVGDNLYVLFGLGGNIAASIGDQGVLIVDTQFPGLVPKYRAAIAALGGDDIDFAINTHWHYDHADGNQRLGPEGVWIVAQENSRKMMTRDNVINTVVRPPYPQPAYQPAALPIASFDDDMQMHFNGETIDLMHFSPAHTTGDAAVFFRGHNAVHMGDVFNNAGYPFIDADNGGDLDGMIEFCRAVLEELEPGAIVIPGHGPVGNYATLERYIEMLTDVRGKIAALIATGATAEQIVAAQPTAAWDAEFGDPARMVDRSIVSLLR